jgi:3-dehydroquinate synthase
MMAKSNAKSSIRTVRMKFAPGQGGGGLPPYDIRIGAGAIGKLPLWMKGLQRKGAARTAFLISDESLGEARQSTRASLERGGWAVSEIAVRAGEGLKDIQAVFPIFGELLRAGATRDSTLFALGGGSIGDAAGFVAATYLRGIDWVGIPTTLLAQVDSSVGGKTGINHPQGKNLVGAFHQPRLVVCDTDFLGTLGKREIVSGLGEVVKYGIAFDPPFLKYLEARYEDFLALDPGVLAVAVQKSLRWKCAAVSGDVLDRRGTREVLNFGHTFGHALESATGYGVFQHGEAVIWGMRFALALSQVRKRLSARERGRIDSFLARLAAREIPPELGPEALLSPMARDKKVRGGKLHFVLLKNAGKTVPDANVSPDELLAAYRLLGLPGGGPQ